MLQTSSTLLALLKVKIRCSILGCTVLANSNHYEKNVKRKKMTAGNPPKCVPEVTVTI